PAAPSEKLTLAPGTGFPYWSFTRATKGEARGVLAAAVCPLPGDCDDTGCRAGSYSFGKLRPRCHASNRSQDCCLTGFGGSRVIHTGAPQVRNSRTCGQSAAKSTGAQIHNYSGDAIAVGIAHLNDEPQRQHC